MVKHNDLNWTIEPSIETDNIINWLKDYFATGSEVGARAVIGMSGGKDSTIAAALLKEAIGTERVIGVIMPNGEMTDKELAIEICKHLGIHYTIVDIKDIYHSFIKAFRCWDDPNPVVVNNTPPRIRMAMLYAVAATCHGRVVNTCNLSEEYIGYSTIFGDNAGSFSPIRDLTVTEILAIGDELGLPREWVHKIPDDGLPHSMPDEEKFGFSYETLDKWIREGVKPSDETFEKIMKMHQNNLFKTRMVHIPSYNPNLPVH
jgi:NAD+ synthase